MAASPDSPDFAVREIEVTSPKLREDLRWSFQEVRGEGSYLLEDTIQGRFYRFGRREHEFAKRLDGRRTVSQLVAVSARGAADLALDLDEAVALVRQLVDAGLVVSGDAAQAERVWDEMNRPQEAKRLLGKGGQLLFLKLPLGNPDRFFALAANRAGWLVGPWFAVVWLVVLLWGAMALYGDRERFAAQMSGLFDFGNLWMLGFLWLVLKVFHECWHGLVCRRFGGAVPEAGVTLLLLTTPLGYVNASSSTAFPSKWQRIAVSAAGIYGELFVAAIAAILWSRTEPGMLSGALHQVVVLSSVTTLLFNANPLMRFDGYYILSDLLDIPNLYGRGQSVLHWLMRRFFLGMKKAKFPLRAEEARFVIGLYGIVAGLWKVLIVLGILIGAALLFEGAGIVLAAFVALTMLAQGIAVAIKYLRKSAASEGLRPARLALRLACVGLLIAGVIHFVEIAPSAKAPAVVRDVGGGEVRVECPGFLKESLVRHGDRVEAGALLARLENVEEESRLRQLETEIARGRLRRDQFLEEGQIAASRAEEEHLKALESIAADLRGYVASLELRSPREGTVDARHLDLLVGTWMEPGRQLFGVLSGSRRELLILARPEDRAVFESAENGSRDLVFVPQGRGPTKTARLAEVMPRASLEPGHFALISPASGPLAVRQRAGGGERGAGSSHLDRSVYDYELTSPRFEIRADLEGGSSLFDGEIGIVRARAGETRSLGDLLLTRLRIDFERIVAKAEAGL